MAADPLDLERLEAVARAATPGPWETWNDEDGLDDPRVIQAPDGTLGQVVICQDFYQQVDGAWPDQKFIAAANPETVLALIAALRAEQARVREAETKAASLETVLDADERNEDLFAHMRQHCHDQIKDIWGAMCFDWDSAPETLKREAHKVARQGLDDVLTKLTKLTPRMSPWKQALDELHVTNWIGVIDGLTPGEAVRKLLECALDQERDELRAEVRALREQVKGLEADREGWSAATFHQADAAQRFSKQLSAIRKALDDMPTMDDPEHMIAFIDAVEEALSPSSDAKERT